MHCVIPLSVDTYKANYSLPRKIENKIKSPVASPLASSTKQNITVGTIRIPSYTEVETSPSLTPPTSEELYERGLFRRLSSGTILASPTVSAMKKAIGRSSSPSRTTVDLNNPKGRPRSPTNREPSPSKSVRLPTISSPASTARLERKEQREPSPIREARQMIRTGGLVVAPQVSPLKMQLKSKSVGKMATLSPCGNSRLSPLRRRGFSQGDEILDPDCEASMSYRRTPQAAEVEMEWDHATKSFVPTPQK